MPVSRVIQYITGHCSTHHTVNSSTTYHKKCPTAAIILTAGFHYEKVSLYVVCSKKSGAYTLEITFFTRVLTYLLPGVCIYSLEHLEDFC